jgi:hypothetical protein
MRRKRKNLLKISKQLFFCVKAKTVYRRSQLLSIPRPSDTLRFALGQGARISRPLVTRAPYSSRTRPFSKGELTAFYILGSTALLLL